MNGYDKITEHDLRAVVDAGRAARAAYYARVAERARAPRRGAAATDAWRPLVDDGR